MLDFFQDLWNRFYVTFIVDDRYLFFVDGLKTTLILTIMSFVLGTLFGILLCAGKRSSNKIIRKITTVICAFFIEIPTMVLLMIMVYIVFGRTMLPVIWVVTCGLLLKCGAYLSVIFNTALDTVASGEVEAARTLGMSKWQAFRYIVLPQTVTKAMPLYTDQFIIALQETSVVGYLALVDLTRASSIISSRTSSTD
jgi:His/Glu/Gln/Arg/opine family amino acid ABC transporter permease subunit